MAYLKTTEEPVFVLGDARGQDFSGDSYTGSRFYVRRPMLSDKGVVHVVEVYRADELETEDGKQLRMTNRQKDFLKLVQMPDAGDNTDTFKSN